MSGRLVERLVFQTPVTVHAGESVRVERDENGQVVAVYGPDDKPIAFAAVRLA